MSSEKPMLYTYCRSSCAFRVRTCLNWKGIDCEYSFVGLLKGEQKEEKYVEVNPYKVVPALKIDGIVLTQSVAIMEYLEETRPEKPLLPKDPHKRALVRSLVQAIAGDIQPVQNLRVLLHIESLGGDKKEWAKHTINVGFEGVEKQLSKSSGKFCVGDEVTLADVCLVPQVFNANRFGVDLSKFPLIQRIANDLSELEAFKKAHPHNQPDCPSEEKK
ncbi:maleylacetoacetate isomerase-like protein [Gigaspora margarita]|uniref:Maleylacetoacetate isomerase-like protein n=1 Tax=Gigaspora margarita TaxID=4874 RepID=A0A8H4EHL1_GIGMA|nr:maleylacetoacetate isomerase-like protein [Gigaspora margarita]